MDDLISIIVPIFNTEKYLTRCLESICRQTYRNLEIILVNDGSKDNSTKICQEYFHRDDRFLYIEKKKNEGLSSARNCGLDMAVGQYVSFIDSDDYIHPKFIELLHQACIINKVKLSMCVKEIVHDDGMSELSTISEYIHKWSSLEVLSRLLRWDKLDGSVCDKLFRIELFEKIRFVKGRISEDLPVTVNILCSVSHVAYVDCPLYFYFQRSDSITKRTFSFQKLSILDSAFEVKEMIINHFPILKKEAYFYYYSHLLYLLGLLTISDKRKSFDNHYRNLKSELSNSLYSILSNRFFNRRKKIKALLIILGLYKYTMNVFKINISISKETKAR